MCGERRERERPGAERGTVVGVRHDESVGVREGEVRTDGECGNEECGGEEEGRAEAHFRVCGDCNIGGRAGLVFYFGRAGNSLSCSLSALTVFYFGITHFPK